MLTLDEAVANYHYAVDDLLLAATAVTTADVWEDRLRALDAAVRNVVMVSARLAWNCNCDSAFAELNANIERRLGPEKAGE